MLLFIPVSHKAAIPPKKVPSPKATLSFTPEEDEIEYYKKRNRELYKARALERKAKKKKR